MLSYEDIVVAYSGSGKGSRLEAALSGSMSTMLPPDERNAIITWVQNGAPRATFEKDVVPVLEKRCMSCHDGSNPHIPNLGDWDTLKKLGEQDTGTDIFTLVRVSHIHLFGLTFIFFIMGMMFSHAYVRPVWLKCAIMALPFCSILIDISSWYFTKLYHPFAFVVMLGGGLNGVSFAFMWVVTMYQMWLMKPPESVLRRMGGDVPQVRLQGAE